jgi:hypothetical protein
MRVPRIFVFGLGRRLEVKAPGQEIFEATLEAIRERTRLRTPKKRNASSSFIARR